MSVDSIQEALSVLGLEGSPDREEVMKAFEQKLFESHPDTREKYAKSGQDYQLTVDRVLEARRVLLSGRKADDSKKENTASEPQPADSDGYGIYREADKIYGDALDAYFAVRKHYSFLNPDHPAETEFRKRLLKARSLFARVIEKYPHGRWMVDSVERIARINNWLRAEGD